MTRLIDADALLEELEKLELRSWNNRGMTRALQGARYINNESLLEAITNAPTVQQSEPFGYFKAEPFGWTDCAETDEGAIALYEAITVQREGWVSVEDRLPEKDGEVLVCAETDDGQYITSMRFDGKDFWHEGEQTYCHSYYCSPTHWQPLPAAPTDTE